jgi:O-antigen biosynthesis protein
MDLDRPLPGAEVGPTLEVTGWAFSARAPIARVEAALGEAPPVLLPHGAARPDVAATYGCDPACGFGGVLALDGLPAGPLRLEVVAVDTRGVRSRRHVTVTRTPAVDAAHGASGDSPVQGLVASPAPIPQGTPAPPSSVSVDTGALRALLTRLREEGGRDATLLDATGLGLAAGLPGEVVATPLDRAALPYADRSFDVVALDAAGGEGVERARPLATRAVVRVDGAGRLEMLWQASAPASRRPRVTVVIPVFNQVACTDACLRAVFETWPPCLDGEVLVVDDASTDETPDVLARWAQREPRLRSLRQDDNRGFVRSCNAGAAAADGDVLVFLNNDTLPGPGWLLPLLAALDRKGAGAAGGKLLFPDGTLQEAGGVIFSDGDGWNFGKHDSQPDHPLFEHVREVDFCSAALLATPRELFLRLGGFDAAYAPAYYEDTDYAFRLRENGYRVYYQPASVVVHLEGASSGRDVTTGVKRHQVANRATFQARWAQALAAQPAHPPANDRPSLHRLHARPAQAGRALVLLPTMPEPDREGGSRRAFHLVELLLDADWAVSVVVENATGGERYARALRQLGAATYAGASTRGVGSDHLARLSDLVTVEGFDLALVAFWHVAERHLRTLRLLSPQTRVLVDSVDLHFLRQARGAFGRARREGRPDALDGRFADELRRELNVYGAADGVLTVSDKESAWIDDLVGVPGHGLRVPLMEDAPGPRRPLDERRGLVFLGNFRHPPNVEALGFLGEVVARLDSALLAAHPLSIVGNALDPAMLGSLAGHPHVKAVGWVPQVEPYLEGSRLSLVPLRHGAGTKAKLLQSLLAGTPCVSTSLGVEGFDVAEGRDVVLADTAAAFASAIERLAGDSESWERLSRDGRAAVEKAHGRDAVRTALHAALEAVRRRTR